jgi:hypothetical protein
MPSLSFNVPDVSPAKSRVDAEVKSINVRLAPPERRTKDIKATLFENPEFGGATGTAITDQWKLAIQDALDRKLFFRDDGSHKLTLSVEILSLTAPPVSLDRFTETDARYELTDRSSGTIVWEMTVHSEAKTSVSEVTYGVHGLRASTNKMIQNNIAEFLTALEATYLK